MDGKHANLTENDVQRRNRIIKLLVDWGLVDISAAGLDTIENMSSLNQIKVISFKNKKEWELETKYNIGKTKVIHK